MVALGKRSTDFLIWRESTSAKLTMFTFGLLENSKRSLSPFPPAPIPAIFNLSLGAIWPLPKTCRGTIIKPAAASEVSFRNFRRSNLLLFSILINQCLFL